MLLASEKHWRLDRFLPFFQKWNFIQCQKFLTVPPEDATLFICGDAVTDVDMYSVTTGTWLGSTYHAGRPIKFHIS